MDKSVLLLHGALGSAAQFDALRGLLPADARIYALNFPGHGNQVPQAPFSMQLFSESVLHFMDENNIEVANIFGYSMGGYVALHLAAEHPKRVGQVITLGTKMDWTPEVAASMNRRFDPEVLEAQVPKIAQALAASHADWKGLCRYTAAFLEDLGNGKGIRETSFAEITCPVTIGRGTEDTVVTVAESRHVAELIPNAIFAELTAASHQIERVNLNLLHNFIANFRKDFI